MASFSSRASSWAYGFWISPVVDASLLHFASGDKRWGLLKWDETNTSDESKAYVRVDILDSTGSVLVSNLSWVSGGIDLSQYSAIHTDTTTYVDIKIKFKLYSLTEKPVIKNISLAPKQEW